MLAFKSSFHAEELVRFRKSQNHSLLQISGISVSPKITT